jgi:long-chain acyl-CoA synthetase
MLNHFGITSTINSLKDTSLTLKSSDSHLSYLPLSHIFERLVMHSLLQTGAEVCFFGGDVLKLRDDWMLYKPTIIPIVPRLINKIYGLIKGNFAALTGLKKTLATKAVASKLYYLHQDGSTHHFLWDTLLFKKTKALFGGRCRMMVTGSAPVAQDVLDFFKVVACCPILEGYGQTETMGASFVTS